MPAGKSWLEEVADQIGHAAWGAATGVLWTLDSKTLVAVAAGSVCAWIVREMLQWPPNPARKWDPWLDSGVFVVATAGAYMLAA